jgi:hypothetical protein
MRKLIVMLAAAAILSAGALANRADAMTAGDPAGIRAALDDVAVTDKVHCVWGYLHHRWWNGRPHWDGCYRGGGVVVGPRLWRGRAYHFRGGVHFRSGGHFRRGGHFRGGGHGGRHH